MGECRSSDNKQKGLQNAGLFYAVAPRKKLCNRLNSLNL
jgi:hypothetical protein